MRGYAEGALELTSEAERHLSQCIVCRACETVCPSGIHMGEMMESFRHELDHIHRFKGVRDLLGRFLLRHVIPHRERIAAISDLMYAYQKSGLQRVVEALNRRFFKRLAALDRLQPAIPDPALRRLETDRTRPEGYPAAGKARLRAGLFLGCIASEWFAPAHWATIRVLQKNGCDVVLPDGQTCCGALHRHSGLLEDSDALFARNAAVFSKTKIDVVLVNAAGCGAALKEPPKGFPQGLGVPVRDIAEFLDEIGIVKPAGRIDKKVAYHQPCHLVHGQRVGPRPIEDLLKRIPGLELVPLADSDRCCGSGGVYNLIHPEMAEPLAREKAAAIIQSGAEIVVTGNPGCALQIRSAIASTSRAIEVLHPIELLDRSYSASP
jgi:glycolate oxidase iron-sulfur subunit